MTKTKILIYFSILAAALQLIAVGLYSAGYKTGSAMFVAPILLWLFCVVGIPLDNRLLERFAPKSPSSRWPTFKPRQGPKGGCA
jgi:hypothetical protein